MDKLTTAKEQHNNEEKISFRELMFSRFDDKESGVVADEIAMHGCEGGVAGLIYYEETTDLYNVHGKEIFEIVQEYAEDSGWNSALDVFAGYSPSKNFIDTDAKFKNAMVWQAVEVLARDYCEREHQEMEERIRADAAGGDKHAKMILGEV